MKFTIFQASCLLPLSFTIPMLSSTAHPPRIYRLDASKHHYWHLYANLCNDRSYQALTKAFEAWTVNPTWTERQNAFTKARSGREWDDEPNARSSAAFGGSECSRNGLFHIYWETSTSLAAHEVFTSAALAWWKTLGLRSLTKYNASYSRQVKISRSFII